MIPGGNATTKKAGSAGSIILVLGDQLSPDLMSLRTGDPERDIVLMAEVMTEATYAPHHKKKIAFVFSAMRHFAEELSREGHCQTKVSQCQKPYEPAVSGRKLTPLGKRGGAVKFEVAAVVKMTFLVEVIVKSRMDRGELL